MPRIQVDTESLTAGGAQQSAAGGHALEAAGALQAAIAAAATRAYWRWHVTEAFPAAYAVTA
jgi:hypothetical protein